MSGRILAVDPGEKRIGLALSDPTRTIASPLLVLESRSRKDNALAIAALAAQHEAEGIIIGLAVNEDGSIGPQGQRAVRLAEEIKLHTLLPVKLWDESQSTMIAWEAQHAMGSNTRKSKPKIDAIAACVILQSYLENLRSGRIENDEEK